MNPKPLRGVRLLAIAGVLLGAALPSMKADLKVDEITDVSPKTDTPPLPLKTPPPAYPDSLKAQKVKGVAIVIVVIDENGSVVAEELKKATNPEFGDPALAAVKNWKFQPATLGGKPVKVRSTVPIHFDPDA